jgi:hypothetical protein
MYGQVFIVKNTLEKYREDLVKNQGFMSRVQDGFCFSILATWAQTAALRGPTEELVKDDGLVMRAIDRHWIYKAYLTDRHVPYLDPLRPKESSDEKDEPLRERCGALFRGSWDYFDMAYGNDYQSKGIRLERTLPGPSRFDEFVENMANHFRRGTAFVVCYAWRADNAIAGHVVGLAWPRSASSCPIIFDPNEGQLIYRNERDPEGSAIEVLREHSKNEEAARSFGAEVAKFAFSNEPKAAGAYFSVTKAEFLMHV